MDDVVTTDRAAARRRGWAVLAAAALIAGACNGDDGDGDAASTAPPASEAATTTPAAPGSTAPATGTAETTTTAAATTTTLDLGGAPDASPAPDDLVAAITAAVDGAPAGCDPLDTRSCLLPFPSDAYRRDGRVALPAEGMPVNASGTPIDPTEWNRNDGFSPNTPILTHVADLDPVASRLPSWTDLGPSLAEDATVVLVDVETGERIALWAELDANADEDVDRLLEIHPAVSLPEGRTYVVGLRGMVTTAGTPVQPSAAFIALRDHLTTDVAAIEDRRAEMDAGFAALGAAGVARAELQLAWTFTTASTESVSGRMLHVRDETLAALDGGAPAFTIDSAVPGTDDDVALQITGTYEVPNYLTGDGGPGNRFHYGDGVIATGDELPVRNGTLRAPFVCNVPVSVAQGDEPAHLVQYGHGLLGSHFEIDASNVRAFADEHGAVVCATKWAGMSEDDVGNAVATLGEFSGFPTMADRLQQGVLNQIVLGRLMLAPDGLVTSPYLQRATGEPMIDTSALHYDGNSQGGIMGLMLAAVSPDLDRAVLGVPGMNYSTLLARSVDFDTYEAIMEPAYRNDLDRVLIIALVQMLWDRGEGAGYVQHVTADPYPGTTPTDVLLHVGFGDWQVSEITAMVAARTMGVPIHRPVTADGRSREVDPGWGLDTVSYPSDGSALVVWDSGSDPIPIANVPPSTSRDSHEDPRADAEVRRQKAAFLFEGTLVDVCDGGPCTVPPRD